MEKLSEPMTERDQFDGSDDMEQVRQLLFGDQSAQQDRAIAVLGDRVAELERLVQALIAHGDASRIAWQKEVSDLRGSRARTGAPRAASQDVTPLMSRNGGNEPGSDD